MKKGLFTLLLLIQVTGFSVDRQKLIQLDQEASTKAESVVRQLVFKEMTDFEKVLILHEYVTSRVKYGKWNGMTSAYTALCQDQADCVGFARSLQRLYEKAGLDSFVVVRKKGHLWVKVKIRGSYYNVDPTWSAVKSRWPQYNWFLLSDAQNVDQKKGMDHVLDSGEVYEAAEKEFVFLKEDYVHLRQLKSSDQLRILGTIFLPEGQKAPAGGISGVVHKTRFLIPEGKSYAFFVASLDRNQKTPAFLSVKVTGDSQEMYEAQGYYTPDRLVQSKTQAFLFNLSSEDQTGIRITLRQKTTMSGENSRVLRPEWKVHDYLAADEQAARYRTGKIEFAAETVPQEIEEALFKSPGDETVSRMVDALMKGTQDPFIKAKRLHDWITLKIAYDSDLLIRMKTQKDPDGGVEPYEVLKYRRSNCDGLASLYTLLAKAARLEVKTVVGALKRSENRAGNLMSHAWNAVKLNGTWYFIDCSADTRVFWTRGKYSPMMDYQQKSDHFLIHPEAKRLAYLAYDFEEQLSSTPQSLEKFKSLPRFEVSLAKYGIVFNQEDFLRRKTLQEMKNSGGAELFDVYETEKEPLILRFTAPKETYLQVSVLDEKGKKLETFGFTEHQGVNWQCAFPVPAKGNYQGVILARSLALPQRVNVVYQFRIRAAEKSLGQAPKIQELFAAPLYGVVLSEIQTQKWSLKPVSKILHPADVKVVSFVRDESGKLVGGAVKSEAFSGGTLFEYTLPEKRKGLKIYIAGMPVPDSSGMGNQRMYEIQMEESGVF